MIQYEAGKNIFCFCNEQVSFQNQSEFRRTAYDDSGGVEKIIPEIFGGTLETDGSNSSALFLADSMLFAAGELLRAWYHFLYLISVSVYPRCCHVRFEAGQKAGAAGQQSAGRNSVYGEINRAEFYELPYDLSMEFALDCSGNR